MRLPTHAAMLVVVLWSGRAMPQAAMAPSGACFMQIAGTAVPQGSAFDPELATRAYLATISPEVKARSDAYFEGQQWLNLWSFLLGAALSILLLATGWSGKMRNLAERMTQRRALQTALYWAQYFLFISLLSFPFALYRGFIREHQYGLSNQRFGSWLGDQAKGLALGLILAGLLFVVLYVVVRRLARTWWIWGSLVTWLFMVFTLLISPVFIEPLFNKYTRLTEEPIRSSILRLARANGIKSSEIYQFDASRQSKRISANVSGFLGTERIALNDNLLKRTSLPEIEAVMGHEIGHYVLNQLYYILMFYGIALVIGFWVLKRAFEAAQGHWGTRWQVRGIGDVAGLPLAVLIISTYFFLLTPVLNTFSRTIEYEADIFGLNAARQPDGMAQAALKLAEYRKLDPGPVEEWFFYDHPSGRVRIFTAMRWKAENLLRQSGANSTGSTANAMPEQLRP